MSTWGRYLRTLSTLQVSQLAWRPAHELRQRARKKLGPTALDPYCPQPTARLAVEPLPAPRPESAAAYLEVAARWRAGAVSIHGMERPREDWVNAEMTRLWRYERQYHRELLALAIAARLGSEGRQQAHDLLTSWLASCPPFVGEAWESYPVARRILNWSQSLALLPELRELLVPHLAGHVVFLSRSLERHLGGNHLLCDAAALVAGSSVIAGEGLEACFELGADLLERELQVQVLPDGGYAERTVQYHSIVFEDVQIAHRLAALRRRPLAASVSERLSAMARWLVEVRGPLGRYPWLNDAAPDATPPFEQVMVDAPAVDAIISGDLELPDTGWSFLREGSHQLLFEHGPIGPLHQPGHGHSDALSFELTWDGLPLIVDTGVTTYAEGDIRAFERSARAHATITVGGLGPDELWRSFRVGGRGRVSAEKPTRRASGLRICRGRLDAFEGWTHHRGLVFWPGVALVVLDAVEGAHGAIEGRFPLASSGSVLPEGASHRLRAEGTELLFDILSGRELGVHRGELEPRDGWVGEGFARPVPRSSIRVGANLQGRIAVAFHPRQVRVERAEHILTLEGPRGREHIALDALGLPA